jgi:hypothetical protein
VIGVPPRRGLPPRLPVDRLSPRTLEGAIARSRSEHPLITTSMYNVDIALQQVKIAEGALAPTLAAVGNVQKNFGSTQSLAVLETLQASLAAQLTVPIYQGGAEYAAIRQAKETLGQRRLDLDTARDQVQATVTQSWGQLEAAKAQIDATQSQVTAAEVALNGVREEARVASARHSTCAMRSRTSSTPAWRSSLRNATAWLPPIPCWPRPDDCFPTRRSIGGARRSMGSWQLSLAAGAMRPDRHAHLPDRINARHHGVARLDRVARNLRPVGSWSWTKSIASVSFGCVADWAIQRPSPRRRWWFRRTGNLGKQAAESAANLVTAHVRQRAFPRPGWRH